MVYIRVTYVTKLLNTIIPFTRQRANVSHFFVYIVLF